MLRQRLWLSCAAVFVVLFGYEWLFHSVLLRDIYLQTASLWRTPVEMQAHGVWMILGQITIALVFGFLFSKGYENQGVGEGVRFGMMVGLLMSGPILISYAVQPIPLHLIGAWVAGTIFEFVLAGIVVVAVYRVVDDESKSKVPVTKPMDSTRRAA